ncbi:MAG: hypothetical protein ACFCU4_09355 [Puniceicoccaceae bacterium]
MNKNHLKLSSALLLAAAPFAKGVIIAEDSFLIGTDPSVGEYALGSVIGQNPNNLGFNGAWIGIAGTANTTQTTGLTFGDLATAGGSLTKPGGNSRAGRLLSDTYDANTSGIIYFSYLMQVDSANDGSYRAFETFDQSNADSARSIRIGVGGGANGFQSNTNLGLRIGDGPVTDLGAMTLSPTLIVGKIDFGSFPGSDIVTIYRDPTDLLVEANNTVTGEIVGTDVAFDRIAFALFTDSPVTFDELRIATTFSEVTPIPEVSGGVFILFGGPLFFALGRRRFSVDS